MNATFVRRRPGLHEQLMCDALWQAHGRLGRGGHGPRLPETTSNSRDRLHETDSLDCRGTEGAVDEVPAAYAGSADHAAEAERLLRRLAPLPRTLLWLHEMEGWTHAELGARFGQSPSWSKSIVSRALGRLRGELQEDLAPLR